MSPLKILGTGSALPALEVDNHMLTQFLDTSDEWISTRTGISSRRILSGETLTEISVSAAQAALSNAGISAGEIDFLICSTVLGDYITPGLGCLIQGGIGATCPTIDINGACAGFIYALDMADAYFKAGKAQTILIVCGESMSRLADWTDRSTCVLFGDGAGAVVVKADERGLFASRWTTQSRPEVLYAASPSGNNPYNTKPDAPDLFMRMAGQEVFKFAVSHSLNDIALLADQLAIDVEQIDHFFIHQANQRILNAIQTRLKLPKERFHANIARTGNTSSATIPILLDEVNRAGAIQPGDLLMFSAFGAGLTTGACALKWPQTPSL